MHGAIPKPADPGEESGDDRHASGLTDLDCLALLSASGMGGRNGFTPAAYAALSDRQIITLLMVEWDDAGRLESEWSRKSPDRAAAGSIARAGRELPSPEMLGLSEADLQAALAVRENVPVHYLVMFWSVWQKRGKSGEEIRALWRAHLASNN